MTVNRNVKVGGGTTKSNVGKGSLKGILPVLSATQKAKAKKRPKNINN